MDKKLRDLDDVNKALKEPPVEEVMERRRVGRRQTAMHRTGGMNFDELRGLLTIPVIVIILMIIIVVLDKEPAEITEPAVTVTETVAVETQAPEETEAEKETEDPTIVREYYDEYLTSFLQQYFDARLQADVDKLYELTGVTNQTEEQKALLQSQLKTQSGYIEGYTNIKQFAVNALEENSKLVFVTYDVKFRRVETAAPGIMYCYVKVNDQNNFEIIENLNPDQTKFVNEYVTGHEEVKELINSSNSKLLQAISSDARLAVIYDAFQSGRIYTDTQENIDSQVSLIQVDGTDVTAAETTVDTSSASAEVSISETPAESSQESTVDPGNPTTDNTAA
ncbi:hypothetical protein BXO88_14035 [Oribacterium sp. C9]|uniref:hypothetical protein n=1 Tax=Oribacterium sp. C9 TaxID=1943579 RepID=UPI00098FC204|nr:hypothetical protein [Oribacterium sp. C9]OON85101.1 hypothetical protein BXO88_14035 [Oribacterium sp. C9]